MKNKKNFRIRKSGDYFNAISKVIIVTMMVSILLGSVLMFAVSKYSVSQENEKRIGAMLEQIENDADKTDSLIADFAENLQKDYLIYNLMHSFRISTEEYYRSVEAVKSDTLYSHGFLKEVYLYNATNGKLYSTSGYLTMSEAGLHEILASSEKIKNGVPIFRQSKIGSEKGNVVCTFFFSSERIGINDKNSFLAVDVSIDEFVKDIASEFSAQDCEVIIADSNYNIQWQSQNSVLLSDAESFQDALKVYYKFGKSSLKCDGEKYALTAIPYDKYEWNIVCLNEESGLYSSIQLMTALWIALTVLLAFLGLYIARKVSNYIYRPIKETLVQLKSVSVPEDGINKQYGEFQIILDSIRDFGKGKRELAFVKTKQRKAECEEIFRRILEHSFELTDENVSRLNENFNCDLKIESPSVMAMISFFKGLEPAREEKELLCFSMANIFEEKLGEKYCNHIYSIVDSSLVFIMNDVNEKEKQEIVLLLTEAKEIYEELMDQKLQMTVCDDYETLLDTSTVYDKCIYLEKYHTLGVGDGCITMQNISKNEYNKNVRYDAKLDENLKQAIYMENMLGLHNVIEEIFANIKTLKYENALLSLLHLSTYTQDVLNDKNQKKLDSDVYDFTALKKSVFEDQSFVEFEKRYTTIVLEFMKKIIKKKESNQNDLLEKVKQYIEEHYDQTELCAQSIADKFKLSAKYLSYAFKEYTGMSLLVYLQKKRIDTACELLENTCMTVGEITYKIGIENENYFYTLFKKNVGMTPKQYRQSKITV